MEEFIESVREVKCLWDMSDNGYKDQEMKDVHWTRIAKQCNMPHGNAAKKQWKKLRDCFREAVKRQKESKGGSVGVDRKPWKYQDQMQFLIPHMKHRQRGSNNKFDQEIYNTDTQIQLDDQYETLPSPPTSNSPSSKVIKPNNNLEETIQYLPPQEERKEPFVLEREAKQEDLQEGDELKEFFSSMYLSTKSLPIFEQLRIKRILFTAVTEAQERNIRGSILSTPATFISYPAESRQPIVSQEPQGTYISSGQQIDSSKNPSLEIHNINSGQNQDTLGFLTFKVEN